jgi:hypothetical protein
MLGGLLGSSPLQPCQHKSRAGQYNHPRQNQRHQRSPRQSRDEQLQARIASDQAENAVCGRFPQSTGIETKFLGLDPNPRPQPWQGYAPMREA